MTLANNTAAGEGGEMQCIPELIEYAAVRLSTAKRYTAGLSSWMRLIVYFVVREAFEYYLILILHKDSGVLFNYKARVVSTRLSVVVLVVVNIVIVVDIVVVPPLLPELLFTTPSAHGNLVGQMKAARN